MAQMLKRRQQLPAKQLISYLYTSHFRLSSFKSLFGKTDDGDHWHGAGMGPWTFIAVIHPQVFHSKNFPLLLFIWNPLSTHILTYTHLNSMRCSICWRCSWLLFKLCYCYITMVLHQVSLMSNLPIFIDPNMYCLLNKTQNKSSLNRSS